MGFYRAALLVSLLLAGCAAGPGPDRVRFATFNIAMGLPAERVLAERLAGGGDAALTAVAAVLQRVRPDVVLLNEFDYRPGPDPARLLQVNYLARSIDGLPPIEYPYAYSAGVNTGVDSGLDLDRNGRTGDPGDAWGFGRFPGQYGMLVLSRFPIDESAVRTFREFRWHQMPGALAPMDATGDPWYPETVWQVLRLSSKSHWDLPLDINGRTLHFLASHPTPSVFDGPEDRNGRRNHDEIRLWADYVSAGSGDYLVDDAGGTGGLSADARFVIAGDLNADPHDGDSTRQAIRQLLDHPRIDATCVPRSRGGIEASRIQGGRNLEHEGDPGADTSDFNDERVGNLRVDYVLPASGLKVVDCGVFWPPAGEPGHADASVSDHHLVWLDVEIAADEATR
jgi:endonuclease/exonuclease/phosphatase family metal-dependent hydrolase